MTGKRRALIVGINDYTDPTFKTLKFAINDARELESVLKDKDIGEFEHVVCLDEAATKRKVETQLARLITQAESNDLVLVYFAGHGVLDSNQQLCLVTEDCEADLPFFTGVPLENIDRMVRDSKCKSVVLMFDCCYSGPKNQTFRGTALLESLNQFSKQDSGTRVVISATQSEQVAREIDGLEHGVFTHHLLQGLKSDADEDRDGYVSIDELFAYVSRGVAGQTNKRQTPTKYPNSPISGIILAKSLVTLTQLQKAQEEIEDKETKLMKLWISDSLDETVYFAAKEALMRPNEPAHRKKAALTNNLLALPDISTQAIRSFEEDFRRLEAIQKNQAGLPKLADGLGGARDERKTAAAENTSQRAIPAAERDIQVSPPESQRGRLNVPVASEVQQTTTPRDLVFISYSHENETWRDRLTRMLDPLTARGLKVWSDKDIDPGSEWLPELKSRLAQTKVAVLLVTDAFLASDFVKEVELRSFLEDQKRRGLTIQWVLVSDCRWDETDVAKYQAAYPTRRSLIDMTEGEQKTALAEITRQIQKAANLGAATARSGSL